MKIFLFFCIFMSLSAQEYAVVAKKGMQKVSANQIRALFLKKTSYIGDKKVVVLNLSAQESLRMSFEKKVLKMNFRHLKEYWIKQHYLGHRPPITLKSQESIIAFIKKVDGAIGYVELKKVDDELKILYRWVD
ncbi:hypothetical protein JHD47_03105 [Sulfurimonas sp. SAG-AH-194-L11]|nr:hypothetical protein [Sulfurimonas sp. SAG-AH-194-L11]MDF1876800.1 hypothetical protein [Sulfurimonas sp. SAG-AH-194-L11]